LLIGTVSDEWVLRGWKSFESFSDV